MSNSTPEGKVKARVNKALKPLIDAGRVWKFMPVQTGYGSPALDYLLCVSGTFVAIETKVPGKNLTPRQQETRKLIQKAGGRVYVVKDTDTLDWAIGQIILLCEQ